MYYLCVLTFDIKPGIINVPTYLRRKSAAPLICVDHTVTSLDDECIDHFVMQYASRRLAFDFTLELI